MVYLYIYFTIIFINFLYINKEHYERIDNDSFGDMLLTIFFSPIFLLYNISKYGMPFKFKLIKFESNKYTGGFKWGDFVKGPGGEGIYVGRYSSEKSYVIYDGDCYNSIEYNNSISIKYRGELAEELAMLEEAQKLQKKANELLAKKKKTIYNLL